MDGNTLVVKSRYDQPKDGVYPLAWLGIMTEKLELGTDGNEIVNQMFHRWLDGALAEDA